MASKKKVKKKKTFKGKGSSDAALYASFLQALLGGAVHAVRLYEKRVNGQLEFDMDEEEEVDA